MTIALLLKLIPLVTDITPVFISVVKMIQGQSGKTALELFALAQVQLDENEKKLLEDIAILK